jgi:ParB family transcriptional regulator, chromosome partitioning protein
MKADLRIEMLLVAELLPDPQNPRTDVDEKADGELTASIALHGVKVPLMCFRTPEGIMIGDGHRRWRCSKPAGRDTVPGYVFPKRPEEDELLAVQLTINAHRQNLNPAEEHDAFERLAKLRGWTPSQLAAGLAISNAEVTRVLSLGKLSPEERELVRAGKVPKSSGYALARISPVQRAGLAQKVAAGEITRDEIESMARRRTRGEKVAKQRICCALPQGTVTVNCDKGLTLSSLIDLFDGLARKCRKFRSQNLDISTAMRVLRDQVSSTGCASTGVND